MSTPLRFYCGCYRSCSTWMSTAVRFYYGVLQVMFHLDEYPTMVLMWCVTGHVPPG